MFNFTTVKRTALLFLLVCSTLSVYAQQFIPEVQSYLQASKGKWNLSDQDIRNWVISDQYSNKNTGLTYTYLQQQIDGLPIFNAISTVAIRDAQVVHFANRFYARVAEKANTKTPTLTPEMAIEAAAAHLGVPLTQTLVLQSKESDRNKWIFSTGGIAREKIELELLYVAAENSFQLAWNVNIEMKIGSDWWNIRIDATNGQFLQKNNWTTYCNFGNHPAHESALQEGSHVCHSNHEVANATAGVNALGVYNVFALPLEAPTFGPRSLQTYPDSTDASPYGWHDTNGANGAEYSITRGNNVYAYEDIANSNQPGYSPNGGAGLNFDFPLNLSVDPAENKDAIITNLFYVNNMLHDILYQHGFDEAAGNFQANNYGKGGQGDDYVLAEAQDGGGTDNANFSTPSDGNNGRMQMYLWSGTTPQSPVAFKINSPSDIAGDYTVRLSTFGPSIPTPITANAALIDDGAAPTTDGCTAIVNVAEVTGKIAIIDRGVCGFPTKVLAAQNAGAVAVLILNTATGTFINPPGSGTGITIPSVMIGYADGLVIKEKLLAGEVINMTLSTTPALFGTKDGSLDNGIVAHELGHGLSTRLTGGPSNSNCLNNGEQAGEGWSDWLALITTIEPGDAGSDARGIGTYAQSTAPTGAGIRRFRYSTNMAVNPQTYASLASSQEVHDIGEIWCDVVWDLTWKLIDTEGFTSDWYNGTGGNITAMRLVIEGMKLQPCGPGQLDGRDAILAADQLLYNGAHKCLIWEVFARRGMGWKAKQGSADAAGDETADTKIPPACQTALVLPNAAFQVDSTSACFGIFKFTDFSSDVPQQWLWSFGDGTTSVEIDPIHSYATPGTYIVVLTVTNTIGSDTYSYVVTYGLPTAPSVSGNTTVCAGNTTTLTANVISGNTATWSIGGNVVFTGTTFQTPVLLNTTTYSVQQSKPDPNQKVGPATNTFGTGGNHNTNFEGRLNFEVLAPMRLKSVLVIAQGAAPRTINLYNQAGDVIETITVPVPNGSSRVTLDFEIEDPGTYSIGNAAQNLYRNNGGATYPYTVNNLVRIVSSNATGNPATFYYYFYDWEVQEIVCKSESSDITVGVTPGPVAGFTATPNFLEVAFSNTTANLANSYSWDFGDGSPVSTVQNPVHTYTTPGDYTVALTSSDGSCSSTFQQIIAVNDSSSSVIDLKEPFAVKVFPNPAVHEVTIQLVTGTNGPVNIDISDAAGRLVKQATYGQSTIRISTEVLPSGVYYIRATTKEGSVVRKVTIMK